MSGGPIDKSLFYEYLSEIEEGMGFLKGNELAWKYLGDAEQMTDGKNGSGPPGSLMQIAYLDSNFKFPCPVAAYQVTPSRSFDYILYCDKDHQYGPGSPSDWIRQLQQNAIVEWHSGANWANGLAAYLGDLCQQFLEPDAAAMRDTCLDLRANVVDELAVTIPNDWADLGNLVSNWHGESALSFSVFYENYGSAISVYGLFTGYVFAGMAAATKIVNGAQVAALNFVKSIRDALREQLQAWADGDMWPTQPPTTPAWLAKTEQLTADAYGLLDDVPIVSTVKGYVDKAVKIGTSLDKIGKDLGLDLELPHSSEPFDVIDSDAMYAKLTSTLSKTLSDYHAAMNHEVNPPRTSDPAKVDSKSFNAVMALHQLQSVKDRYDFTLPYVPPQSLIVPPSPGHHGDRYR